MFYVKCPHCKLIICILKQMYVSFIRVNTIIIVMPNSYIKIVINEFHLKY